LADPTPAEKSLADWVQDYLEADPEDRLSMDGSVERLLADAELANIPKDEVVKAADGDIATYINKAVTDDRFRG
jgi:hypothetical protein